MSGSNFIIFKTPRYCPNVTTIGYAKPSVSIGDMIRYKTPTNDPDFFYEEVGRVLALVKNDGCGKPLMNEAGTKPTPWLCVLQLSNNLSFGYERYIPLWHVREIFDMDRPRDFLRWFMFGKMPPPELAIAVIKYGAMSDSYLAEYLDGPEGSIRPNWHDIAMKRWRKDELPEDVPTEVDPEPRVERPDVLRDP